MKKEINYNKEEWGGWKIVSDMLDHPDKNGIYPTSKCYQKLYDFVIAQKEKARQAQREEIIHQARQRYKCGACDTKVSNLSHTMLCQFLQTLNNKL